MTTLSWSAQVLAGKPFCLRNPDRFDIERGRSLFPGGWYRTGMQRMSCRTHSSLRFLRDGEICARPERFQVVAARYRDQSMPGRGSATMWINAKGKFSEGLDARPSDAVHAGS